MTQPTITQLLVSLRSTLCPTCGKVKVAGWSVCGECERELPMGVSAALWHGVFVPEEPDVATDAYAFAIESAMRQWGKTDFIIPDKEAA